MFEEISEIQPLPKLEEAIREIIDKHNFASIYLPGIGIYVPNGYELDAHYLYTIDIKWENDTSSRFKVSLHVRKYLDGSPADMGAPLYVDLFRLVDEFSVFRHYEAVIDIDYPTLARFVTYYMQYLGLPSSSDITVENSYSLTRGDISLVKLSDAICIPRVLQRAFDKLKSLAIPPYIDVMICIDNESAADSDYMAADIRYDDTGLVRIYSNIVAGKDYVEKRHNYRNFDCIKYQWDGQGFVEEFEMYDDADKVMRFMTDYFLFLNPAVNQESISVILKFSPGLKGCYEEFDDLDDWYYCFYPDGTETDSELLDKYIDEISTKYTSFQTDRFLKSHGLD